VQQRGKDKEEGQLPPAAAAVVVVITKMMRVERIVMGVFE